jgi:hypothetical protein
MGMGGLENSLAVFLLVANFGMLPIKRPPPRYGKALRGAKRVLGNLICPCGLIKNKKG